MLHGSQPSGSATMLKRRRGVRGADVRRSCSCFRLFADSDRWRSDRRGRVRLRLNASTRSKSNSSWELERRSVRIVRRRQRRRAVASSSELACRLKALRVARTAACHEAATMAALVVRTASTRWTRRVRRRRARGEPQGPTESTIRSTSFQRQTEARCHGVNRAAHRCSARLTLRRPSLGDGRASTRL